jgi:hypothetical protein
VVIKYSKEATMAKALSTHAIQRGHGTKLRRQQTKREVGCKKKKKARLQETNRG